MAYAKTIASSKHARLYPNELEQRDARLFHELKSTR